jgi:hypothetical protein
MSAGSTLSLRQWTPPGRPNPCVQGLTFRAPRTRESKGPGDRRAVSQASPRGAGERSRGEKL